MLHNAIARLILWGRKSGIALEKIGADAGDKRNDKHDYAELQSVLFEILLHISLTPICFSIPSSLQSGRPMTL